jgi:Flp pilus assembly protein CpaB
MMHDIYEDLLLLYMTRSISVEQLAELQTHLAECPQCRASLNEWRAIALAVRSKAVESIYSQEKTMSVSHPYHYTKRRFSIMTAFTLMMVLLVAGLLTFLNRSSLQTLQTPLLTATFSLSNVDTVELVFAARPIENGAVIHADDVRLYPFPVEIAPLNVLTNIDDVIGHIARTNIACGEIILQSLAVENARDVQQPQPEFDYNRHECGADAFRDTANPYAGLSVVLPVVVARNNIPAGSRIEFENITTVYYPADLRPAIAAESIEDIAGRTALVDIYREEMILSNSVYVPATATPLPIMTTTPFPTFTLTWTPTPTPTLTLTPTLTPTWTPTPTPTPTLTLTPMPTATLTHTWTVTPTATLAILCEVRSNSGQSINVRAEPSTSANRIAVAEADEVLSVIEAQIGTDGLTWYRIRLQTASSTSFEGWVRSDAVNATTQSSPCPNLTQP